MSERKATRSRSKGEPETTRSLTGLNILWCLSEWEADEGEVTSCMHGVDSIAWKSESRGKGLFVFGPVRDGQTRRYMEQPSGGYGQRNEHEGGRDTHL